MLSYPSLGLERTSRFTQIDPLVALEHQKEGRLAHSRLLDPPGTSNASCGVRDFGGFRVHLVIPRLRISIHEEFTDLQMV